MGLKKNPKKFHPRDGISPRLEGYRTEWEGIPGGRILKNRSRKLWAIHKTMSTSHFLKETREFKRKLWEIPVDGGKFFIMLRAMNAWVKQRNQADFMTVVEPNEDEFGSCI